jgi:hypothetical protein
VRAKRGGNCTTNGPAVVLIRSARRLQREARRPLSTKLPLLSAYLGHQNIVGTEVYLKATPQLLELASCRFEQHLRDAGPPR